MQKHIKSVILAVLAAGLAAAPGVASAQVIVVGYSVFGVPISPWLSVVLAAMLAGSGWWLLKRRSTGSFFVAALAVLVAGFGVYATDVTAGRLGFSITGNSPFTTSEIGFPTNCNFEGPGVFEVPFQNGMPYGITINSISVSPNQTWQLVADSQYCQVGQLLGANGGTCTVGLSLICAPG